MGSAEPSCSYCLAAVPVETLAGRPACERCAKDIRDGVLLEQLAAAEVQTSPREQRAA